jgi:hypothetical protein
MEHCCMLLNVGNWKSASPSQDKLVHNIVYLLLVIDASTGGLNVLVVYIV